MYQEGNGIPKGCVRSGTFCAVDLILRIRKGEYNDKYKRKIIDKQSGLRCHVFGIGNYYAVFPVLLCGYVCGWKYGLIVGAVVPLLRSVMFGMPPLLPTAAAMAFELAAYGAFTGILYKRLPKTVLSIYISLAGAMIAGRLVWGLVSIFFYGIVGNTFSIQIFLAAIFFNAIPGIILQIVLIPAMIMALKRAKAVD